MCVCVLCVVSVLCVCCVCVCMCVCVCVCMYVSVLVMQYVVLAFACTMHAVHAAFLIVPCVSLTNHLCFEPQYMVSAWFTTIQIQVL